MTYLSEQILALLTHEPRTTSSIMDALNASYAPVQSALDELFRCGEVAKCGKGWSLAESWTVDGIGGVV